MLAVTLISRQLDAFVDVVRGLSPSLETFWVSDLFPYREAPHDGFLSCAACRDGELLTYFEYLGLEIGSGPI